MSFGRIIEGKFKPGEKIFYMDKYKNEITIPCDLCSHTGKLEDIKNKKFTCPKCRGKAFTEETVWLYGVHDRQYEVEDTYVTDKSEVGVKVKTFGGIYPETLWSHNKERLEDRAIQYNRNIKRRYY